LLRATTSSSQSKNKSSQKHKNRFKLLFLWESLLLTKQRTYTQCKEPCFRFHLKCKIFSYFFLLCISWWFPHHSTIEKQSAFIIFQYYCNKVNLWNESGNCDFSVFSCQYCNMKKLTVLYLNLKLTLVKVKFTLNTFSVLSHERSGAHETLLEKLWKEERGQYGLTIKKIINWKNQWSKTDSESGNGKLNQDSKQQEAIESNKAYTMAKVAFEEYDSWRRIQYLGKLDFTRNAKIWKNGAEKVLTKEEMELINEFLQV